MRVDLDREVGMGKKGWREGEGDGVRWVLGVGTEWLDGGWGWVSFKYFSLEGGEGNESKECEWGWGRVRKRELRWGRGGKR